MVKKILRVLAALVAITVIVIAFMAYFSRSIDVENNLVFDGLGRELTEPPFWAKFFLTSEHSWAGLGWHLLDIVWFFGGFGLAFKLYEWGEDTATKDNE